MRCALLTLDGLVVNVIVADPDFDDGEQTTTVPIPDDLLVSIGDTLEVDGDTFTVTPGDRPPPPAPAASDVLGQLVDALGVEGLVRSAVLGADLAGKAPDLWAALTEISPANTARPAIEIVTDSALTAAATPIPTQEDSTS